ncbi:MAG: tetratricopeptide repeat protein [Actinobacteria bacterium]|nr:tetratricopeptide repeat protein [Actinomycetota bacterium]
MTCPSCGAAVVEAARFCSSCGHALRARGDERRVVTVLFADLVGFTSLSESRDPERVKNLVDTCFERLAGDVTAFGGRVDKVVGDALVALFGAPLAHEDDAERAVRAALQMQRSVATYAEECGIDVRLRVGVNTGEVLVGALRAGGDYTAMGDVVNVASRLQTLAGAGDVVVGPDTYAATRGVVAFEPLGLVQARGREEPVDAWTAIHALAPPGRRPRRAKAPLIGRESELGLLRHTLTTAVTRQRAHVVVLLGEAGIGKSRLAEEMCNMASDDHRATVLEGRCVPYGEANVWWPVAEALRQVCDIDPDDPADTALQKCRASLTDITGLSPDDAEVARLAEGLLHLMGHESALQDVDPARAPAEARRSLQAVIQGLARTRPLVIALSELHWADDLLLNLIDELLERAIGLPVLVVITARPELEERWVPKPGRYNVVTLHLDPLDAAASARLLSAMLESPLPADLRDLLLERSGGNPFFLEELVSLLAEAGVVERDGRVRAPGFSDLPATLRGLIAARIDGLSSSARSALEDAAVIGRTGNLSALCALGEARGEVDVEVVVQDLAGRDLLTLEDDEWSFRSDLVREVAYDTLTKAERARRHGRVGNWLTEERRKSGREEEELEQLAYHLAVAAELTMELGPIDGVPTDVRHQALKAIERAAMRVVQRDQHLIARSLMDRAFRLLDPNDKANRNRVLLHRARASAHLRDLPSARADVDEVLKHVDDDDRASRAGALAVRGLIEQGEASWDASSASLEEALSLSQAEGDVAGAAEALRLLGMTKLFSGDGAAAEQPIAESLEAFRQLGDRRGEAWALQNLAWIAFTRGEMTEAEERLDESAAAFRAAGDQGGLGWALGLLGFVRYFQGRYEEAGRLAQTILAETRESGDRWGLGMTYTLLANVRLFEGRVREAVEHAREALSLFTSIGDAERERQTLGVLARALVMSGDIDEGLQIMHDHAAYSANFAGLIEASTAVQLGDPDMAETALAAQVTSDSITGDAIGDGERGVVTGLAQLQLGRVGDALAQLEQAERDAHTDGERAFARAALALAFAADGDPEKALSTAATLPELSAGTYIDRMQATVARGLALARLGRTSEAETALTEAVAIVDGTDDLLDQAVARLGRAIGFETMGRPDAAAVMTDAHRRLRELDIDALGWETAFRLAAGNAAVSR